MKIIQTVEAKKLGLLGLILVEIGVIFGGISDAKASKGILDIMNYVTPRTQNYPLLILPFRLVHSIKPDVSEGYDNYDSPYYTYFDPDGRSSKTVSIVQGHELDVDLRPIDSTSPVYLEISIHLQGGGSITISSKNELRLYMSLAGPPYFYDFGKKPITLWRRNIIDPNDPNNYTLSFLADIREGLEKSNLIDPQGYRYLVVPLADLNGTYGSEVPYFYAQVRFDTFPGDSNLDGRVDLEDLSYIGRDWMVTDINSVADISGSNGIPDKNVDYWDLSLFTRDYLKDSNDPNTW